MLGQILLDKYRVTRLLDEGGMSKVYLARQVDQPRDAVVKVLKEEQLASPKAREHFRREIFILSRFSHPNAVAYYDSSTRDPSGPVLIMEYLRGVDLLTLLHRHGRFTPERTGRLLAHLCDVLQAAHEIGVVHRDIKPGNLMVLYPGTPQETLKLMDFGLAKMASLFYISPDDLVDFSLPAASGTPEYICPEMVRGNDMDARGDLYSVGVVLFELLTGKRPFDGGVEHLMLCHRDEPAPSFRDMGVADIPPALEAVVQSCLAKVPERRPKTAWDLALAYEKALGRRITTGRLHPAGASKVTPPGAASQAGGSPTGRAGSPAASAADRHTLRQSFEANMPEALAIVKLKGFIYDLGGEVVESVPGMIKVRLQDPEQKKPSGGLLGWMSGGSRTVRTLAASTATDLELHMERPNPAQSGQLKITLVMRAATGLMTTEWRNRCSQITRDLQAYLMGR